MTILVPGVVFHDRRKSKTMDLSTENKSILFKLGPEQVTRTIAFDDLTQQPNTYFSRLVHFQQQVGNTPVLLPTIDVADFDWAIAFLRDPTFRPFPSPLIDHCESLNAALDYFGITLVRPITPLDQLRWILTQPEHDLDEQHRRTLQIGLTSKSNMEDTISDIFYDMFVSSHKKTVGYMLEHTILPYLNTTFSICPFNRGCTRHRQSFKLRKTFDVYHIHRYIEHDNGTPERVQRIYLSINKTGICKTYHQEGTRLRATPIRCHRTKREDYGHVLTIYDETFMSHLQCTDVVCREYNGICQATQVY